MDLQSRAARAAKKRNNRTRRALPLLDAQSAIPADWLTTPDAQLIRIERQLAWNDGYWERFQQAERERAEEATRLREIARSLVSPEAYAELEQNARYFDGYSPVYALDYWHNALAKINPVYCPHYATDHYVSRLSGDDHCPICGMRIELPARQESAENQMSFFKEQ
jgi:hypothetical protein